MSPKTRTCLYLGTLGTLGTLGLFWLAMIGSGVMDLAQPPLLMEGMRHLGYPAY